MAVRTYYGTCKTASGETEKKVYVPDIDLTEEEFNFKEGDLLVVFFAQTNTASAPSIVVYLQDPEDEISTTSDSGKDIKSVDVEANIENAWAAGETVIFAYTQLGTTNNYYWELIDAFHASKETYGNTKLFDDTEFSSWIGEPEAEEDSKIALTPNTLKKFFNLLRGNQSEEEEESVIDPPIGLYWEPTTQGEEQTLGYLSLSNGLDEGSWLEITYPIEAKIQSYIHETPIPTHTGELINNGNGYGEDLTADPIGVEGGTAEPFITRVVPDELYFGVNKGLYYGVPYYDFEHEGEEEVATAWPRIILNDTNNYLVLGDTEDTTLAGITINKPTEVNGNLRVNGTATSILPVVEGETVTSASGIITNGIIQEQNQPLSERYGPDYKVLKKHGGPHEIAAHAVVKVNDSAHIHIDVSEQGWTPIGVVGYNVNYSPPNNSGDALYSNVWECYLMYDGNGNPTNTVEYSIFNMRDKVVHVQIDIYVLYRKNL